MDVQSSERRSRLAIDNSRCRGHGFCYTILPSLFSPDDDGYATALQAELTKAEAEQAREAEATCPESAIKVTRES